MPKIDTLRGVRYENLKSTVQNDLKRKENGQNGYATHTCIRAPVCAHLTLRYKNPLDFYTQIPKDLCYVYVGSRKEAEG